MNNNKKSYKEQIQQSRQLLFGVMHEYAQYRPKLAKLLGGIKEAIFFERLFFWSDKGNDPDGWVYKTKEELELETFIPRTTQDRIRQKLVNLGVVETKNSHPENSTAPTLHYKINNEGLNILVLSMTQNGLFHKPKMGHSNDPKWVNAPYTGKTTGKTTGSATPKGDTKKFSDEDLEMSNFLADLIQNNNPDWKKPDIEGMEKWAQHIENLHRIDGRTYEQIKLMIRWTQQDKFWQQCILSTDKLRKQFNNLIPKMKAQVLKAQQPVKPKHA